MKKAFSGRLSRLKSNNRRRIALKRNLRKINLRRQFFYNREMFSQQDD